MADAAHSSATTETTVTGIVVEHNGGPEVLTVQNITLPPPASGEALVRHVRIGVNFVDIYRRTGADPVSVPFVPGMPAAA